MTKEEAIEYLKRADTTVGQKIKTRTAEALEMAIKALEHGDVLDKIKAEIERLHYHPKLDFIKNDEVVEMVLDIIDKYKAESEGKGCIKNG